MPQFVIERDMPGVGGLGSDELRGASQKSSSVLRDLGPEVQWFHSYVRTTRVYCIYRAPNEDLIRKHAETAGFPANSISQGEIDDQPDYRGVEGRAGGQVGTATVSAFHPNLTRTPPPTNGY